MGGKARFIAGAVAVAITIATASISGFEGRRYVAYQDVGGKWTLCDGHTDGVKPGDRASDAQCNAWRDQDIGYANAEIDRCIHAPLNPNQRAALISATYNIGPRIVCGSTLQRLANAGEPWCAQLLRWVYAGGSKPVNGLIKRRRTEYAICIRPDFSDVTAGSTVP